MSRNKPQNTQLLPSLNWRRLSNSGAFFWVPMMITLLIITIIAIVIAIPIITILVITILTITTSNNSRIKGP